MRETIKPGSLSKRAAALGLKPRRTHDCSQGLNLDPRDSKPPPCLQRNLTIRDFKTLSDLSLSLSWLNGEGILIERPEQPVWKAGGVNPDVTPVRSVRPHAPRWEEQQQQWSQFGGAWALVGTEKVGAQGDYQRVDDNFVRPPPLSAIWHPPPQIVPPWSTQTEGTERKRRIVVIAFGHQTLFAPLSQSVQTKQCRQCMEPSIRNKWGELCFSAKTTKTTAWQPPKFRSGKTEWINVEWEKEHHYTGFALIWHQHPPTTA